MAVPVRRDRIDPAPSSPPEPARPQHLSPLLTGIDERFQPTVLARDEFTPVLGAFEVVLGSPGIRRGSTLVIESAGPPGATSVALALLAAATTAGRWCAIVGLPETGLVAGSQLGLALDRLVLVPFPSTKPAKVLATLLEGCEIVLVAGWGYPSLGEARRLAAHARERRSILLSLRTGPSGALPRWPEPPDVALRVVRSRPDGLREGSGRLSSRFVVLDATRRRMTPRTVTGGIWLPGPDGAILAGDPSEIALAHSRQVSR